MIPSVLQDSMKDTLARYAVALESAESAWLFPELLSVEEVIEEFIRELGRGLLQTFVNVRAEQVKAARPQCGCGQSMSIHAVSHWIRGALFGEVEVKDVYLYCRECKQSARPVHALLGTDRERWSLPVQEAAVDLASDESCGRAVEKLTRLCKGVEMGRTTALRLLHEHGSRAGDFIESKLAAARAEACREGERKEPAPELEVEFDGGMIPVAEFHPIEYPVGVEPELTAVRGLKKRRKVCRWEEAKVSLVQRPGEVSRLYSARPTSQLEEAFEDMFALAWMKGWSEQTQVRGIADGARYIRSRMADTFSMGKFKFILDRPHCKQHLAQVGTVLEMHTGKAAAEWAAQALEKLERGQAMAVVGELKGAYDRYGGDELRLAGDYFERNADAVAYAEYRDKGWGTASSEVESAHRHVVQRRMKLAGAWWNPDHVSDILALRVLKANGWWKEYWSAQRARWKKEAGKRRQEGHVPN